MKPNDNYTQLEAHALVGSVFESLVEFYGVPAGTHGRVPIGTRGHVVRAHPSTRGGYDVVFEWALPARKLAGRRGDLHTWFWKELMERYMEEVKS